MDNSICSNVSNPFLQLVSAVILICNLYDPQQISKLNHGIRAMSEIAQWNGWVPKGEGGGREEGGGEGGVGGEVCLWRREGRS